MRSFSLPLSDCGLTQAVFLRYFWNFIIMGFGLPSEFVRLRLCRTNEHGFAKDNFVIFSCLSAKAGAAHSRRGLGQSPINPS